MNAEGVVRVLAKMALYDRRTSGEGEIMAWLEVIGDLDLEDALEAVGAHYRTSTDWLMPATLREGVRAIEQERRRLELLDRARRAELQLPEREVGQSPESRRRLDDLRRMLAERYDLNGTIREAARARRERFMGRAAGPG